MYIGDPLTILTLIMEISIEFKCSSLAGTG